jgi:polynucleotide 5'-hydroxyl-kinase GRC3/NOL9
MERTVRKGNTLLVDGPASVIVKSGIAETFGSTVPNASKVVVREGKRLPFVVWENAAFEISLGNAGSVDEVEGDTVPSSWSESCEEFLNLKSKPATALVLGNVDSGKTSFCTYLVNKILRTKLKLAILDGDIGQSDIGPPSTVAYSFVNRYITDLFSLRAKNGLFIGETSPSQVTDKVISGLVALKSEALANGAEAILINTDGWVEGDCAVSFKIQLTEALNPDVVFYIQQKDELALLVKGLERFKTIAVEFPSVIKERDVEKRRGIRELGYIKYLRDSKVQSLSLSRVRIEGNDLLDICRSRMSPTLANKISGLLGMKPLHMSEIGNKVCIIIGRKRWIDSDCVKRVEDFTKKKVFVSRKGEEEGMLAGMYDSNHKFLGVGTLQEIDYLRKNLKVSTPVMNDICILALGKIRLDKNMKEIQVTEETVDFASFKRLF